MKMPIRIVSLSLLVAASAPCARGDSSQTVSIEFGAFNQANAKQDGNKWTVKLPEALKKAMTKYYPGLRLPTMADHVSGWKDHFYETEALVEIPYLLVNDFNNDRRNDVAAFLIGGKQEDSWKLVVFNQTTDGSFQPYLLSEGTGMGMPQYFMIETHNREDQHKSIYFTEFRSHGAEFYWDKTGFKSFDPDEGAE